MLISFGMINRLRHLRNHFAKKSVKGLSGPEVKAMTCRNLNEGLVVRIDDRLAQAQINHTVVVPQLCQHINIGNRHTSVSYLPPVAAYGNFAPGFDYNFILRHQKPPVGFDALASDKVRESSHAKV